jgi:hypothetical protein
VQPVVGARPSDVFSRWMKVVFVNLSPPSGPSWVPSVSSRSQATAPGATKVGSVAEVAEWIALAKTLLESWESCHDRSV